MKRLGLMLSAIGAAGIAAALAITNVVAPCCILMAEAYITALGLLIPIFVALLAIGLYLFFKPELKVAKPAITKILTHDEKAVIAVIRRRKWITQADLRLSLGMSKAKLSMLLAKMRERGLVKKVKRGRTNIVLLGKI
jgi:hypothetical protein